LLADLTAATLKSLATVALPSDLSADLASMPWNVAIDHFRRNNKEILEIVRNRHPISKRQFNAT
jgi:hypothetical protein